MVKVLHFAMRCEACYCQTSPKITPRAARLAFSEYLGFVMGDGRALCHKHAKSMLLRCYVTEDAHQPDESREGYCLLCGWPIIPDEYR